MCPSLQGRDSIRSVLGTDDINKINKYTRKKGKRNIWHVVLSVTCQGWFPAKFQIPATTDDTPKPNLGRSGNLLQYPDAEKLDGLWDNHVLEEEILLEAGAVRQSTGMVAKVVPGIIIVVLYRVYVAQASQTVLKRRAQCLSNYNCAVPLLLLCLLLHPTRKFPDFRIIILTIA